MIAIEKNTDVKIKCYKCGKEYDMNMMRMDSNGKNLVCKNCLERKSVVTQMQAQKMQEKPKQIKMEFKEYFCKECKYNFKRAEHLYISVCPYCGSSGTVVTKRSTARIIADASKMKG